MQGRADRDLHARGGALSIVGDDLRGHHPRSHLVIEGTMRLVDKGAQTMVDLRSAGYEVSARVLRRASFRGLESPVLGGTQIHNGR